MISDPYSILGVGRNASDREIKRAYRNMSRKYHPVLRRMQRRRQRNLNRFRRLTIRSSTRDPADLPEGMEVLMAAMAAASPIPRRTSI